MDSHANFAYSVVTTAPAPAAAGGALSVQAGTTWPATPFNAVVCPVGAGPTQANAEIVRVTGIVGSIFTISRAQEGTTARAIQVGDQIFAGITLKTITDIEIAVPMIGAMIEYAGTSDPAGGAWVLADGRLIDKTVYASFNALAGDGGGHRYNNGVDPGSNKVRIPDRRGRVGMGPDNMGTAQGAAGRIAFASRALGQAGGEERHQLIVAELASHGHPESGASNIATIDPGSTTDVAHAVGSTVGSTGLDQAHNNLQPYEVDNVIVRIA